MAYAFSIGLESKRAEQQATGFRRKSKVVPNAHCTQRQGMCESERTQQEHPYACDSRWWQAEPNVGRVVDGMAAGVDRLKAIGNGQVPAVAATAFALLVARGDR